MSTKTEDQIREIATDVILEMVNDTRDADLIEWVELRYDYLSREDVDRVLDAFADAKVSVSW